MALTMGQPVSLHVVAPRLVKVRYPPTVPAAAPVWVRLIATCESRQKDAAEDAGAAAAEDAGADAEDDGAEADAEAGSDVVWAAHPARARAQLAKAIAASPRGGTPSFIVVPS